MKINLTMASISSNM